MSQHSSRSRTTRGESSPRPVGEETDDRGAEAVDPDVDLHVASQRREWSRHRFVLPVIAAGGVLGASARHGAAEVWSTDAHAMPWTTLTVNAIGCLLIGVLMVFVVEIGGAHPLLRPFAGVGILGGFTTYSTYTVDTSNLIQAGRPGLALGYWSGTLVVALVAVATGVFLARAGARTARWFRRRRRSQTTGGHTEPRITDTERGRS
jgi:CrcB protein